MKILIDVIFVNINIYNNNNNNNNNNPKIMFLLHKDKEFME
jgi:hypothetical protein